MYTRNRGSKDYSPNRVQSKKTPKREPSLQYFSNISNILGLGQASAKKRDMGASNEYLLALTK